MHILKYFIFLLVISFSEASDKPTVCLNMIIKDEKHIISRCLESIKPIVDYWVIVDTGSTDGSQDFIKKVMQDIPGELHERPWVDFSHNRNEALELAKAKGDYLLIIDADEVLEYDDSFSLPFLNKDYYYIETNLSGTYYKRIQLINNRIKWKWTGILHEVLESSEAHSFGILENVTNLARPDGNRSKDKKKFHKDIEKLQEALKNDPNNRRYMFYLAQSFRDANMYKESLTTYEKRVAMGGWDQEIFWSLLQIARLKEKLDYPSQKIISAYWKAYLYRPTRAEPLYYLACYCRSINDYKQAYQASCQGIFSQKPDDILFIEGWVYNYGILMEHSLAAYWNNYFTESVLASKLLLSYPNLPENYRLSAQSNLSWALKKGSAFANPTNIDKQDNSLLRVPLPDSTSSQSR